MKGTIWLTKSEEFMDCFHFCNLGYNTVEPMTWLIDLYSPNAGMIIAHDTVEHTTKQRKYTQTPIHEELMALGGLLFCRFDGEIQGDLLTLWELVYEYGKTINPNCSINRRKEAYLEFEPWFDSIDKSDFTDEEFEKLHLMAAWVAHGYALKARVFKNDKYAANRAYHFISKASQEAVSVLRDYSFVVHSVRITFDTEKAKYKITYFDNLQNNITNSLEGY